MSDSLRARVRAALTYAHSDNPTLSITCEPFEIRRLRELPVGHAMGRFVDSILRANALRDSAQTQLSRLVSSFGVLSSMARGSKKPRVHLWAELNCRDTLEVYFSLEAEKGDEQLRLPRAASFADLDLAWPYASVRKRAAFRAKISEYTNCEQREFCTTNPKSQDRILEDALTNCLGHLVESFKQVADVTLGDWPKYTDRGVLTLQTVDQRVAAILIRERPTWTERRMKLDGLISEKLRAHGLESVAEFEALVERATRESVKVTALIFAEKGVKCSSLGTNKLAEHIADRKTLDPDLAAFEAALAAVANGAPELGL